MEHEDILKNIKDLKKKYTEDLKNLDIDVLFLKYLGKKGEINSHFKDIVNLTGEGKVKAAKELNEIKVKIETEINELREKAAKKHDEDQNIDLTVPVAATKTGNLNPITIVTRDLYQFFHYYGFSVHDGPEIEDDKHNFEIMGVPKDHPAREMQDTFYLMEPEYLLRTQTSSIEARELEKQDPPIRFVYGGKVFRNETVSKSNGAMFHQFQGVCVDKDLNMANLKWIFTKSLKHILGEDTQIRFRAKYYPEVEPGMSPDVLCTFCKGDGCEICKYRGWIEIAGGGMIHPNTLKAAGIDPDIYSGFAFGWGLDRIAMQRFKIRDLRLLTNGNIVYK
jgi:phenylalanyl-tRNA synthetase alpha chain